MNISKRPVLKIKCAKEMQSKADNRGKGVDVLRVL